MNHLESSTVLETEDINQALGVSSGGQSAALIVRWTLPLLCVISIIPFWTVRYPVITDYPTHLARWFILFHINDKAYHFANLYAPAWGPLPYISPDLLAMGLQYLLPIDIVGRCVLSLCVLLVAYATYFFLKITCPANIGLASFGIFMALTPNFQMGSISNEFSLALCLLVVSLWVCYCRSPKLMTAIAIAIGLTSIYLSHLSGFVIAGLTMGVYGLFQERRWRILGTLAILSLPALLLFIYNPSPGGGLSLVAYPTIWDKLRDLSFPFRLYTSRTIDLLTVLFLAALLALVLKAKPAFIIQWEWLAVCASLLLIYFVAPGNYGVGAYIYTRFLPFLCLFFLAVVSFKRTSRWLYLGLALLVLFRVATWEQLFLSQQHELKELSASFQVIPRNAKVLPLNHLPHSGVIGTAEIHHLEYGIIQRGFLDPQLLHLQGIQPIRLVGSPYCINVFCDVAGAPQIDWQRVANSYDYLWVSNAPETKAFTSHIGEQIFSNDFATVYRVRKHSL